MTQTKQDELAQKFVANLAKLDAGDRARLKRNAGSRLQESRGAMGLFYKQLLPPDMTYRPNEDWYFLVATLYPLEKEQKGSIPGNFGDSLRRIRNAKNEAGLDRRLERLLDADEQQLPFQLRQAVHFLTSNRGRINWERLLKDLLGWTRPDRYVQRQWARAYFAKEST